MKTYVIAEAGVNHNGDAGLASELLHAAADSGADAIKFQTFRAKNLVTNQAQMAVYQKENTGKEESQLEMLRRLELAPEVFVELAEEARKRKIDFLSTAFDKPSLDFLVNDIEVSHLKIASGEITNGPFLLEHARTGKPVIMSTGMCTLGEIEQALAIFAFGWRHRQGRPRDELLASAYRDATSTGELANKITMLHCTTQYPTPPEDVNLAAMETIHQAFQIPIGYSDHTQGITVPIAAVARGATIIEKHFTLDRSMEGPDHAASLEPDELAQMVTAIRITEVAIGQPSKCPSPSEIGNLPVARKSLVASKPIKIGDLFSKTNLTAKRPGEGVSPMHYWSYIDKAAIKNYAQGDLIDE